MARIVLISSSLLPMSLRMRYAISLGVYIADNMFIMTNYLVPRLNVSIPMSEIKWMMFQDEIVICKKNGDSIIAYHKLSDDQLMEFEAEVRAMGIVVVR